MVENSGGQWSDIHKPRCRRAAAPMNCIFVCISTAGNSPAVHTPIMPQQEAPGCSEAYAKAVHYGCSRNDSKHPFAIQSGSKVKLGIDILEQTCYIESVE